MLWTDPVLSRLAYRIAEWAAWRGLIPDALVSNTYAGEGVIPIPTRWFFTRAIRYGIIDGSMYRDGAPEDF